MRLGEEILANVSEICLSCDVRLFTYQIFPRSPHVYHPDNDTSINPSANESIRDVIERASRRQFLKGSVGAATLSVFGGFGLGALSSSAAAASPSPVGGIGFPSVAPNVVPMLDKISVPPGYTATILTAWGDPVSGGPAWNAAGAQTEAEQLQQQGMHHDGMRFFPFQTTGGESSDRGLLVTNHEYTDEGILHTDLTPGTTPMTLARARTSQAAHGVSIVELRKIAGKFQVVRPSPFGRRITANTPMTFSGPAAGNAMLQTAADPTGRNVLGTVNNCAHGFTPWGTYLTCEENFNGYFGTTQAALTATPLTSHERRYGLARDGFGYRWHQVDPRFDFRANPNEPNRFGWVVEIDPFAPGSTPIKRTALGRFKHEGAWTVVGADNSVTIYMGDDERNDYMYKFVCAGKYNPRNRAANRNLLDSGTLYVAKFNADNSGTWLPLVWNQNGLTPANGFADQGEVLIKCRQAADRVGATMMDRPEWVAVHPTTREVYLTLTNNNRRGSNPPSSNNPDGSTTAGGARPPVDAANPRAINVYGHIIRWRETGGNVAATTFNWDIFVQCGDSLSSDPNRQGNINGDDFGAPDGLWFDKDGRLWIQTDQQGDAIGDWVNIGGNSMLAADPATGQVTRFLTSPPNCEVTGVDTTPDGKTMFVNIQHPGEDWTGSFISKSQWPDNGLNGPTTASAGGAVRPRAATVMITRDDGGVIGAA